MTARRDRTDYSGLGAAAGEEVTAVDWPLLLRQRVQGRVARGGRERWWVLATVMAGLFSVNFTFTIFAVALPRIADELGTTPNTLTWVLTAPMLAFGVVAPTAGKAGDRWGHKRMYLLGMGGAALAAALTTVAWDAGSLIAVRTLGSIEGAATGAASMAMIFRSFGPDERVKAMGWWSLVGAGGPVLGVAIGGPVIEHVGWRVLFGCQVPLTLAALVVGALVLTDSRNEEEAAGRFDIAGGATLTLAVTSLLFALNRGGDLGWSHGLVVAGFVTAPVALAAFVAAERRADDPLIPLDYLRRPNFVFPNAVGMTTNFAYMGGFVLTPLLLARVFDYTESRIGLVVVLRPLSFSLMAPVAGYLAVRFGERSLSVVGPLVVAGSMLVFSGIGPGTSVTLVMVGLVLSGIGVGMSSPSVSASIANAVDEDDLGVASAAQQLMTQVGLVAGIQLMSTLQATSGFAAAFRLGAGVCLLGAVAGALIRSQARERGAPAGAPS